MTGDIDLNGNNLIEVEDIYIRDRIYHDGDTNTYIQFHSADQWRVVTGATERLEVNNSRVFTRGDLINNDSNNTLAFQVLGDQGLFDVFQNVTTWSNSTSHPILKWDFKSGVGDMMYMASGGNSAIADQMALVISDLHGFKVGRSGWDGTDADISSTNEFFRITTAGNVGIGTSSPDHLLHIGSTDNSLGGTAGDQLDNFRIQSDTANTDSLNFTTKRISTGTDWVTAAQRIQRKVDSTLMGYIQFGHHGSGTNTGLITFGEGNGEYVRIDGAGNVGIGNNNPAYKLEVEGDIKVGENGTLWFSDASNSIEKIVNNSGTLNMYADSDIHFFESDANVRRFTVNVNDGQLDLGNNLDTTTAQVHFDYHTDSWINGSNLGIGTTSPAEKLHVNGTILSTPVTYANNQDQPYLIAGTSGYTGATTNWNTFGFQHRIKSNSGGTPRITIDTVNGEAFCIENGGNIGIGTTSPSSKLDVNGNITGATLKLTGELNLIGSSDANKYIDCGIGTNALTIRKTTGGDAGHESMARFIGDGGVELYHNNVKKFETTSIGVTITDGSLNVENAVGNNIVLSTMVGNGNDSTFVFQKSRGGSGGPSQITGGDHLGQIVWKGYDTDSYNDAASITCISSSNTGDFDASLLVGAGGTSSVFSSSGLAVGGVLTTTGAVTIDVDDVANGALRINANQTTPVNDFYFAQEIVSTLSGSTTFTGDKEQGGIFMDINSTATGGGTSHEHRAYGMYIDLDVTGDADVAYGIYAESTATPTTGTVSNVAGIYGRAEDNGGDGAVSTVIGVRGEAYSDNSTSDINNMYGGYFRSINLADTGNVGAATGCYAEIEIPSGTGDHYGNSYVFRAEYDNNDSGVAQTNTTYLYYGNYAGTLPTTAFGIHIADDVKNYFGGNVGIGTNSPSAKLHTVGTRDYTGTTPSTSSYDNNFQSGTAYLSIGQSNGIPSIQGHGTGTAYHLVLAPNNGNVGVGTSGAPSAKLDVNGNIHGTKLAVGTASNPGSNVDICLGADNDTGFACPSDGVLEFWCNNAEVAQFTNTGINFYEAIDSNQSIKTSSTLIECGEGSGSVAMTINDGAGNANVTFNHAFMVPDVTGSSARIETSVDSTNAQMIFELKDSVTAGTSTGLTNIMTLDIGAASVTGSISATADITAYSSDRRLKENFRSIEDPIDKIKKLNGYIFDWNDKSAEVGFNPRRKKDEVGLIAQEVQDVIPQAVAPAPFDSELNHEGTELVSLSGENYLTVQYEKLVPLLVESIKEQQKQIDELRQEIKNIRGDK